MTDAAVLAMGRVRQRAAALVAVLRAAGLVDKSGCIKIHVHNGLAHRVVRTTADIYLNRKGGQDHG
jgi:hypothetical protein